MLSAPSRLVPLRSKVKLILSRAWFTAQLASLILATLVGLVGSIRLHAEQVAGSSHSLAHLSDGLHQGAERQVADTAQIRDALGELEQTIQQVASDASQTAQASQEADRAALHSQQVICQSLPSVIRWTVMGDKYGWVVYLFHNSTCSIDLRER